MPPRNSEPSPFDWCRSFRGKPVDVAQAYLITASFTWCGSTNAYLFVLATAIAWLGRTILQKDSESLYKPLLFRFLPLLSPALFFFLHRVTAEQMLVLFSYMLAWAIFFWTFRLMEQPKLVLFTAVTAGLGMATKITFFPLTLAPLFFLKNLKEFRRYCFVSLATFFVVTLPMAKRLPRVLRWVGEILDSQRQTWQRR